VQIRDSSLLALQILHCRATRPFDEGERTSLPGLTYKEVVLIFILVN